MRRKLFCNRQILALILFYALMNSSGCSRAPGFLFLDEPPNLSWSNEPFVEAYSVFGQKDYKLAKTLFAQHLKQDSSAADYEGYAFLAECFNKSYQPDSGRVVYLNAIGFLQQLKTEEPDYQRYDTALQDLQQWSLNYPQFPPTLLEKNGFIPHNIPPVIEGGWMALARNLKYPEPIRKLGIEGTVLVHVLIDEKGNPIKFEVAESLNPLCDRAAINAVKAVRFIPATLKGQAAKVWLGLPITFRLR